MRTSREKKGGTASMDPDVGHNIRGTRGSEDMTRRAHMSVDWSWHCGREKNWAGLRGSWAETEEIFRGAGKPLLFFFFFLFIFLSFSTPTSNSNMIQL
jgi:hypothetical protein